MTIKCAAVQGHGANLSRSRVFTGIDRFQHIARALNAIKLILKSYLFSFHQINMVLTYSKILVDALSNIFKSVCEPEPFFFGGGGGGK